MESVRIRSYWVRLGPDPVTGVLVRGLCEDREFGAMQLQAKDCWGFWKPPEARGEV